MSPKPLRKVYFTLGILIFFAIPTFSQSITLLDSFKRELVKAKHDTTRCLLLAKISKCYWENNPDSSVKYAKKGISLSEKIQFKKGIAQNCNNLGCSYNISGKYVTALEFHLRALKLREELKDEIGLQASYSNIGSIYYSQLDYKEALKYFTQGLAIAERIKYERGIAILSFNIGTIDFQEKKDYSKALKNFLKALDIQKRAKDKYGMCNDYANIGETYIKLLKYDSAQVFLNTALGFARETDNREIISKCMNLLAEISLHDNKIEASLYFANEALDIAKQIHGLSLMNNTYETLYNIYKHEHNFEKALEYHVNFKEMTDSLVSTKNQTQMKQKQFTFETEKHDNEIKLYEKDRKIARFEIIFLSGVFFISLFVVVLVLRARKKEHQAKIQLEEQKQEIEQAYSNVQIISEIGRKITANLDINDIIETVYSNLSQLMKADLVAVGIYHEDKKHLNFPATIENNEKLVSYSYDLSDENRLAVVCFKKKVEIHIDDFEKEFAKYISKIQQPTVGSIPCSVVYLPLQVKEKLVGVITVQDYKANAFTSKHINILRNIALYTAIAIDNAEAYNQIQHQKHEISEKNEELNQLNEEILIQRDYLQIALSDLKEKSDEIVVQRDQIGKQKKDITDSIVYASRIQHALLHNSDVLNRWIPNHFILFKPRNFVSGDFYWCKQFDNMLYLAVADCTGHGVPGAFMSMLGISLLNEIVAKNIGGKPSLILDNLRTEIKRSLSQTGEKRGMQDGMDISFCIIDLKNLQLQFAGAHNPLYLFRKSNENEASFFEYKGDRMPIGIHPKDSVSFTDHQIELKENDTIYLFSDGYQSQYGGEKGTTFKSKRLKETLLELQQQPIHAHKQLLVENLVEWQGANVQVDDILMIGLEVKRIV